MHLLPEYPKEMGPALLVRFYVQMPAGFNLKVLPAIALSQVVTFSKNDLEKAIGKNITGIEHATPTPTTPTASPTEKTAKSSIWKLILVGICLAVALTIVVIIIVYFYW